jgi:hypothetical protein
MLADIRHCQDGLLASSIASCLVSPMSSRRCGSSARSRKAARRRLRSLQRDTLFNSRSHELDCEWRAGGLWHRRGVYGLASLKYVDMEALKIT